MEHQIKNNITKTDEIPYVHPPDPSTSSTMPAQIQDAMQNNDVMSRIIQAREQRDAGRLFWLHLEDVWRRVVLAGTLL